MNLKPQDVCILLKIVALDGAPWSYSQLAYELGMSASEVHAGVKRASQACLLRLQEGWGTPDAAALEEFLVHGLKYAFPPVRGGLTRGIPTSRAAPPLNRAALHSAEPPPVWPDEKGEVRGYGFSPLYKSVPFAVRRDARLYELLALVDAIRSGEGDRDAVIGQLKLRLYTQRKPAKVLSLARARSSAPARARAPAAKARRGNNGQEGQRVYRRRHRDP